MSINKITIKNFKIFENFEMDFTPGINMLVGDNEIGKSTVIEAIHLVLTGLINGKYLNTELTQNLFNNNAVSKYIKSINEQKPDEPPKIVIEIYLDDFDDVAEFKGINNSKKLNSSGISLVIEVDDSYAEYSEFLKTNKIMTLPIEYYDFKLISFADKFLSNKFLKIKSVLIDSSQARYQNGSDIYISRIVKQWLDKSEIINISQTNRHLREKFMDEDCIKTLNSRLQSENYISYKNIELSIDFLSRNAWENSLMTYIDKVPFQYIGKGEQCIIKTKLALTEKKSKNASVILMEEPENHLSHTKLNQLIDSISKDCEGRQIIISTHNNFVANKLGIDNLILLGDNGTSCRISDLSKETRDFFNILPGYQTLRLVLSSKTILVEGPSDELIVQKAYIDKYDGKLPIEDCIDVISVGTAFLRFLEIADRLNKCVSIVTDNDGKIDVLQNKYGKYIQETNNILISYDKYDRTPSNCKSTNQNIKYNTLENLMLIYNSLELLNQIFQTTHQNNDLLLNYMENNKTVCALKIFQSTIKLTYPDYIMEAIEHVRK